MKYGAKMAQWAPFAATNPEPASALPNYGEPINLGSLNKVTDSPSFNEGKGYGDNAPYGGLGFYITKMLDGNVRKHQGVFYPKVKATMQGEEYATKGESITLSNSKLHFVAAPCNTGDWKILSEDMDSETAAAAWVNGKVKKATGS